jgi:GNAT superfamily N-acetyltransferase
LIADGEYEACNDFYNRIHGRRRTIEQWRWEFVPSVYKCSQLPFAVVEDDGRIVGTQALIPIRMIDEDGVFWTAKSEETLVDPDYRGQRLFEQMYRLLFDYAEQNGLAYVWGFTAATRAFKRLGFQTPAETSQLFFPFSARSVSVVFDADQAGRKQGFGRSLLKAVYHIGCATAGTMSSMRFAVNRSRSDRLLRTGGLEVRTLDEPPEEAGELCKRFVAQWGGKTIYRDTDYLRWRIFDNPHVKAPFRAVYGNGRLLGWVAFSIGDDGMGYLVDLMIALDQTDTYSAESVARVLLKEAVYGTRNMGAVGIRGWRVNDHPFDRIVTRVARSIGFHRVRGGHAVVLYMASSSKSRKSYDRFADWFVSRIYTEGLSG